ncbi:helix-turn-helix domain-containing protein [Streptomyces sp. NBC_01390]|uniref:helix-turn-helix domain-containing protein n=1 Tax=Streptomyces sp. NBC_01390 TaxID=2903850 RepID=UPI003868ED33
MVNTQEFGRFLSSRRARISPLDIGLTVGARRRVPGLRRDEVALQAGISVEYYIELEQGRATSPSAQVLAALSRALRLTRDETEYLYSLAGISSVPSAGPTAHVEPALLDLLRRLRETPALIATELHEVLVRNDLATALLGPAPARSGPGASLVSQWFQEPEQARARFHPDDQPGISATFVADLRATSGRFPGDRRIHDFVDGLVASNAEFAALWAASEVKVRRTTHHRIIHPALGSIDLECTSMFNESGRQRLVWYTPRIGGEAITQFQLLATVGTQF